MEEIVSLISTLGFPAACAVAMFVMNEKQRAAHKEEIDKLSAAVQNNSLVVQNNTLVTQRLLDEWTRSDK